MEFREEQLLGKVNEMIKDRMVTIDIEDAELSGDIVWFFSSEFNGLFSKNIVTGETRAWGKVPGEKEDKKRLYTTIKKCENRIFLIPFFARELAVFEIAEKKYIKVKMESDISQLIDEDTRYMGVEVFGDKMYIFGVNKPVIVVMDIYTYHIDNVIDVREIIPDIKYGEEPYFRKQIIKKNNNIYATLCRMNDVLEIECRSLEIKVHQVGNKLHGFSGIDSEDGVNFVLAPMADEDSLLIWNKKTGSFSEHVSLKEGKRFACVGAIIDKNKIDVFPSKLDKQYLFDNADNIEILNGQYSFVKRCEDVILSYERLTGLLSIYHYKCDKKIRYFKIEVSIQDTMIEYELLNGGTVEGEGRDLKFLLQYIYEVKNQIVDDNKCIGKEIYSFINER